MDFEDPKRDVAILARKLDAMGITEDDLYEIARGGGGGRHNAKGLVSTLLWLIKLLSLLG